MAILAVDIGATKTLIAAFDKNKILAKGYYETRKYQKFEAIIKDFLENNKIRIRKACIGIAGVVKGNACRATNINWVVDGRKLSKKFKFKCILINDVEAMGYGLLSIRSKELIKIQQGISEGSMALMAIGTGLGEAIIADGRVIATEGGHSELCPKDELEWQFKRYMQKKHLVADAESAISGTGLCNLYDFLCEHYHSDENILLREEFSRYDKAAAITEYGLMQKDKLCMKAIDMFISFAASEAQNLCLKAKATGGLYLAGGIPHKLASRFKSRDFLKVFVNSRMHPLLEEIQIYIVADYELGLKGAALFCNKSK